jgi:hypothetical protein
MVGEPISSRDAGWGNRRQSTQRKLFRHQVYQQLTYTLEKGVLTLPFSTAFSVDIGMDIEGKAGQRRELKELRRTRVLREKEVHKKKKKIIFFKKNRWCHRCA